MRYFFARLDEKHKLLEYFENFWWKFNIKIETKNKAFGNKGWFILAHSPRPQHARKWKSIALFKPSPATRARSPQPAPAATSKIINTFQKV